MIIIFTFNREKALSRLLDELEGKDDILVLDDGSTYPQTPFVQRCNYKRSQHGGRKGFWKQWDLAFKLCKGSGHDEFIFLPDDWENLDIDRIYGTFGKLNDNEEVFASNICNVGWNRSWTPMKKHPSKYNDLWRVGFVDHGLITNRKTLEMLEWRMYSPSEKHFKKNKSSGVGKQISKRLMNLGVPMFKPVKSLASHQDVESVMHPDRGYDLNPI